jgi:hypothetical protein
MGDKIPHGAPRIPESPHVSQTKLTQIPSFSPRRPRDAGQFPSSLQTPIPDHRSPAPRLNKSTNVSPTFLSNTIHGGTPVADARRRKGDLIARILPPASARRQHPPARIGLTMMSPASSTLNSSSPASSSKSSPPRSPWSLQHPPADPAFKVPMECPTGVGNPLFAGTWDVSPPIAWRVLAGAGNGRDRGGDGGVIPGHPRPRRHLNAGRSAAATWCPTTGAKGGKL